MRLQRSRCSLWAQQGSNLRPLGEQRSVYQGCLAPTDHAEQGSGVYPTTHASTPKADHKLTTDLGQRGAAAAIAGLQAEYEQQRAEIMENAYNDLIDLVSEYGNRELKDRMWALVRRTAASVTQAFEASRPSGDRTREGVPS